MLVGPTYQAECASWPASAPWSCVGDGVVSGGGSGIVSLRAEISLERFEVAHSALCGLQVAREGAISSQHGSVHHNAVGANIQVPEYDLSQITNDTVRYYENETNLHTQDLPLPEIQQWPIPGAE